MIKKQYALLDHTAQIFLNPLTFTNDGDAIRWFTTIVNEDDDKSNISKYPHQFTLFRLADYDDQTGQFQPRDGTTTNAPKELITGIQVQNENEKSFTVKQLITMLKAEIQTENIIDLPSNLKEQAE